MWSILEFEQDYLFLVADLKTLRKSKDVYGYITINVDFYFEFCNFEDAVDNACDFS